MIKCLIINLKNSDIAAGEVLTHTQVSIYNFFHEGGKTASERKLIARELLSSLSPLLGPVSLSNSPAGNESTFICTNSDSEFIQGELSFDFNPNRVLRADKLIEITSRAIGFEKIQFGFLDNGTKTYFLTISSPSGGINHRTFQGELDAIHEFESTLEAVKTLQIT